MTAQNDLPAETWIESWEHLCSLVLDYRKSDYWLFRGLRSASYRLIPKIGRDGARRRTDGTFLPYDPDQERIATEYFIRAARHYTPHPSSRLEWLAVAQHHGMQTALLDWTESLFVSAYFAVEAAGTEGIPTICAVKNIPVATDHDNLDALPEVARYHPPHISPRIPAQRSVFTIHKTPDRFYEPDTLQRWFIQQGQALTFRLNLDACGINKGSLFPDIDGLSEYTSWLYKWGRLPPGI